jgi:hypothetical protein
MEKIYYLCPLIKDGILVYNEFMCVIQSIYCYFSLLFISCGR